MSSAQPSTESSETMFEGEYAHEMDGWFRRRFRNLCIGILCILTLSWGLVTFEAIRTLVLDVEPVEPLLDATWMSVVTYTVILILESALVLWYFIRVRPGLQTQEQLISASTKLLRTLSILSALVTTADGDRL